MKLVSVNSVLASGIGIAEAYFLEASDIELVSHSNIAGVGDSRISGNAQLKVDMTGLKNKINGIAYTLSDFLSDTTPRLNSDYFEWSVEVITDGFSWAWPGHNPVYGLYFHSYSLNPFTQVLSAQPDPRGATVGTLGRTLIDNAQAFNLYNIDANAESWQYSSNSGRLNLTTETIVYIAALRFTGANFARLGENTGEKVRVRVSLHPKGALGAII